MHLMKNIVSLYGISVQKMQRTEAFGVGNNVINLFETSNDMIASALWLSECQIGVNVQAKSFVLKMF